MPKCPNPLGDYFGYLVGAVDDSILNLVYNLADKIAFKLVIMLSEVHGH